MKLIKKLVLIGLPAIAAAFVIFYGYRIARAERHRAFDQACARGDTERVALLLHLGAYPNGVRDAPYYTRYAWTVFETTPPLHLAASGGHTAVVRLLLSHGADSTARGSEQMTAQDCARIQGHTALAQLLATHQPQ